MSAGNEDDTEFSKASTARVDDVCVSSSAESDELNDIQTPSNGSKKKPFLGGYKHKLTGTIYYHVATQTIKPPWNYDGVSKSFCRESQTVETKDQVQQTPRDAATQVEVRSIFIQTSADKFTAPSGEYVFADDIQSENLSKVIIMQRYVRRWLAQRELKRLQQSMLDKLTWEEEQKKKREKQDRDWLKDLQKRKLYPIKEDDFLLLFSDLQNWWEYEADEISKTKSGPIQHDAMLELLNDEAKKISDINKIKMAVENEKSFQYRQKSLVEAGKPKLWKGYKKEVSVITGGTQKGKSLQDLYGTLSMKCVSAQDRINGLQSLIQLLQKHNSKLTNSLLQLAHREIDLLLRGTKVQNLEGLRSRIQDLFWQYVKQPIFNPEMYRQPKLTKTDGKEPHIFCCAGCKQFYTLPTDPINEAVGKGVMGNNFMKCKKCLYLENEGWIRKDNELYKKVMKLLIQEEEKKPTLSSIIYMIQPCDVKHLIELIWKRQSCLSGDTDERELELVRYNVDENWTPWNCMLVTREEAAILSGIPNSKDSYDDQFKKFVYQRHVAARSYFASIPRFLPYVAKSTICKDYDSSSESEED